MLKAAMSDADDLWSDFEPAEHRPNTDGVWFLFEPAEPPFSCTAAAARVWLQMELEMWEFFVKRSLTSDVEPLFPEPTQGAFSSASPVI